MESLGVAHLDITKHLANMNAADTLKRLLLGQNKCIVRLYVISAYDLSSRDNGSDSDPYLNIIIGNKVFNDRANYLEDEANPDFYKVFEFEAVFPGCPLLNVQIYDYDDLFGDDLIGETKIDLEDRFFSPEWQSIRDKPIEYRQLYHQSSSISQGVVKLWVDIIPTSVANEFPKYDITPRPP
jgi:Ca2+-dependent lipid-binding protein